MHLNQCSSVASVGDVSTCVSQWLLKTTTDFHGWGDRLRLPWWYGALCLSYTAAGVVLLMTKPKWMKNSSFPYVAFSVLICIQGPLSFMADYMNMTNDSIFHVIDRVMASFNMFMELMKLILYSRHARRSTFSCQLIFTAIAITSFMRSQEAQKMHNPEDFVVWHSLWHSYPVFYIALVSYDFFVLGDYDALDQISNKDSSQKKPSPKPPLLSSVIMNDSSNMGKSSNIRRRTRKE